MRWLRAIVAGIIAWALIFVEWSIIIFMPGVKDIGDWQYLIHYVLLIPIVIAGVSFYYGGKKKPKDKNNIALGVIMLATGLILDALVTIPFFVIPQGGSFLEFYLSPLMLIGYLIFLVVAFAYRRK